jgi:putative component of toxin-antitoxin plasmid stabilization module
MTEVRVTVAYLDWINGLRDHSIRSRIQMHVDRLVHGHRGAGGDKSTQSRDIARAIHLARNWNDT